MARSQAPPAGRRRAILDAATQVFARYGFRRASIDDVARQADVAKGTVYLYFASKEALFASVVEAVLDEIDRRARAAAKLGSLEERLVAALAAKFAYLQDLVMRSPHAAELLDSSGALTREQVAAEERRYERRLTALVKRAEADGELRPDGAGLSAGAAAALLIRSAYGSQRPDRAGRPVEVGEVEARLGELVRLFVRALAPPRAR